MATTSTVNDLPAPADGDGNDVVSDLTAIVAVLDTGSVVKRLTSTQIGALTSGQKPAGLVVYNTTTGVVQVSNGSTFGDLPGSTPIGGVQEYAGTSAPAGWLMADGSAVSRTTYAALFAICGTTFGAGNGTTTFNLPNRKGRVGVGVDAAQTEFDALGETGGAKTVTLSAAQSGLPAHTHTASSGNDSPDHTHGYTDYRSPDPARGVDPAATNPALNNIYTAVGETTAGANTGGASARHTHSVTVNANTAAAASSAHDNLPPYLTMNYIIRAA